MSSGIVAEVVTDEVILVEPDPKQTSDVTPICRNTIVRTKHDKKPKHRRTPWTYFQVLVLGAILLLLIIGCVVFETISRLNSEATWSEHSDNEKRLHMRMVDKINEEAIGWKAEYNRFASFAANDDPGWLSRSFAELFGSSNRYEQNEEHAKITDMNDTKTHIEHLLRQNLDIPESFDARLRWPLCWSVHQIYNQAGCGSCWSVSSVAVMSDRICIASNGTVQKQISADDLTSCCTNCGGCEGTGWALSAFSYWKDTGIVSGGAYGSNEGCRPYTKPPTCGGPCSVKYYEKSETPTCQKTCQSLYGSDYESDLSKASQAYWLWLNSSMIGGDQYPKISNTLNQLMGNKTVEIVQKEIMLHGPVLTCFSVYEDLQHYKSGIYKTFQKLHVINVEMLYGHCVKMLGWGVEPISQKKYWLMANTWGREWGENGFFRIAMEDLPKEIVAGIP